MDDALPYCRTPRSRYEARLFSGVNRSTGGVRRCVLNSFEQGHRSRLTKETRVWLYYFRNFRSLTRTIRCAPLPLFLLLAVLALPVSAFQRSVSVQQYVSYDASMVVIENATGD